ncbi:Hsp20 family protein [Alteromonas sp. ASW11-130]|uniref:Hsp20 family protein n=1 Tax=Alteromonas sp. ASW11-130 TaxID=3015775 RepID=UPI002242585C|nr:Hsp20 family protein [Alteromonas sp. ASW11-130]MCW8090708.1 Hsp20 family protein [Alteromonas sp. ASW11-130]
MRTLDLSPLYRSFIGFDRLASALESSTAMPSTETFPPYNIESLDENRYRVSMALAGYSKEQLTLTVEDTTLKVTAKSDQSTDENERKFLHRGIEQHNFERKFQLGEHIQIREAEFENGLLHIDMERVIPEEKKPKQIAIGTR